MSLGADHDGVDNFDRFLARDFRNSSHCTLSTPQDIFLAPSLAFTARFVGKSTS